ncbi:MAG: DnaJ domain-containing protein [Fluviicola sp.]|nr:DnaJ domain-containing protein [Fluviicola sp.]
MENWLFLPIAVIYVILIIKKVRSSPVEDPAPRYEPEPSVNQVSYMTLYTTRNIMVVYAYLAGWMMKKNVSDSREKMKFIRLYFNRYFKGEYDISEEMTAALRNVTDVDSVVSWLNRKMKDPSEKQRLVEFLIALAMEDGSVTQPEFDAIVWFGKGIGFSQEQLEQWIQLKKYQKYRQQQSQQAPPPVYRSASKKQEALNVLGLSESVSEAELKKVHRKLVKSHHPDTLLNATAAEKEKAEVRFIRIQEAYEYLLNEV